MRNFIQAPYFASGNPETDELATLYAPGMLGCVGEYDQGGISGPPNVCRYQLVQQASAIQVVAGNVLYWSDKTAFKVTTARSGDLAGVSRIAAAAAATYIWVLKKGNRAVLYVDAPASTPDTTGKPVVGSDATDGKADCLALAEGQAAFPLLGVSTGTVTSHLGNVRVNIPDTF